MANITQVNGAFATNNLEQTFNVVLPATPIEGNILIAFLWHDETGVDVATITSAGWRRMNTHPFPFGGSPDFRISIFAKFVGASETTTTSFDLGEANKRAHGFVIQFSGQGFTELADEDTADKVTHENTGAGTSNQVGAALTIPADMFAVTMVGLTGVMTIGSFAFNSGMTKIGDANSNFRGSGMAWLDGADDQQPTATWTGSLINAQMFVVIGVVSVAAAAAGGLASFRDAVATDVASSDVVATDVAGRDVGA